MDGAESQSYDDLKHRKAASQNKAGERDSEKGGPWPEVKVLMNKANANKMWVYRAWQHGAVR